jgi:hypothetical protein
MYVRTWKDRDMVATSDSNPTGSASNDEPEATSDPDAAVETDPSARSDATGESAPEASPSTPPAAVAASSSESTRPAEPAKEKPRSRSRRSGPAVSRDQVMGAVNGVRERVAAIVWIIAVVFAVILIAGALLIALEANPNNDLVEQVKDWATQLDGPFSNLFTFDGDNAVKKAALTNWGLAAAAWLVGGKIVSSIIRP